MALRRPPVRSRSAPPSTAAPALSGRACDQLFDLAIVALSAGDVDTARGLVTLVRAKARNRNMAFAGTTLLAEVARRARATTPAAQQRAIEGVLRALPRARASAGRRWCFSSFRRRPARRPRGAQTKQQLVSPETARGVLYFSEVMPDIVRHRARFLAAVDARARGATTAAPGADYAFAPSTSPGQRDAREVRVAVWDLGTNPELFRAQLIENPGEQPNGQDDDGNGLVDDIHGIAQRRRRAAHRPLLQPRPRRSSGSTAPSSAA
jgi:hypothetical protein